MMIGSFGEDNGDHLSSLKDSYNYIYKLMRKKKKILGVMVLLSGLGLLTGCSGTGQSKTGFKEEDKISVVTTIYPMYDFVSHIAGDKAEVINLVPAGIEPHDFELSTGDKQLMETADLFIYNGAGMESFVDKTLAAISNEDLVVVEGAENVSLIQTECEEEHEEESEEHEHGEHDPHTWLSVKNAILEAENIKDALVEFDQENANYYEANFEQYKKELEALDARYETELAGLSKNTIVVAHQAFGYLCQEYGLQQEAVEGLTAESEPDAARMKEIIEFCKEKEIKVIFFEELVSPKVAQTIANEIGADTAVLNPVEGLTKEQEQQQQDYIDIMEQNLEELKKALK